jgi:hypothetical protein
MPPNQPAPGQVPPSTPMPPVQPQALPPQPDLNAGAPSVQGSGAQAPTAAAPKKPVNPNTTQNSLQLSEVRENMVIMRDGSFRAVVA